MLAANVGFSQEPAIIVPIAMPFVHIGVAPLTFTPPLTSKVSSDVSGGVRHYVPIANQLTNIGAVREPL